jgi:hypothetical protein
MKPHKWAKEIIAWANGAEIEYKDSKNEWNHAITPYWHYELEYRIKPQPKEDIIKTTCCFCGQVIPYYTYHACSTEHNIKPQPKEPQYLYVYKGYGVVEITSEKASCWDVKIGDKLIGIPYAGKIKLEMNDE